jgi:pimeloyl-ACP methyl ester carboxylesterase
MDHSKWLRRFVYCRGAYIAVYQYYSFNYEMNKEADVKPQEVNSSSKDVVLLLAGCANSVAIYTMLGDRSLPDYLFNNGYDVWAMDLRGHGEVIFKYNFRRIFFNIKYLHRANLRQRVLIGIWEHMLS